MQRKPIEVAIWAVVCTTWSPLCRLGEMVPAGKPTSAAALAAVPSWSWLFVVSDTHWLLVLPRSKTDVFREGSTLHLWASGRPACPNAALRAWARVCGLAPGAAAPLFGAGGELLLKKPVIDFLRAGLAAVGPAFGFPASHAWSNTAAGHSLRRGAATSLLIAGVPEAVLKALGRWSSQAYLDYLDVPIGLLRDAMLKASHTPWCGFATLENSAIALASVQEA